MSSKHNPFTNTQYDLGIGDDYGYDRDSASENILRTAYTHSPKCFACTATMPQYRIVAKQPQYNTAEVQKGLYVCRHCLQKGIVDPNQYAMKELE